MHGFVAQLSIHANRGDTLVLWRFRGLVVGCMDGHLQSVGVTWHFEGGNAIQREVTSSEEAFQTIYATNTSDIEGGEQGSYEI